MPDRLRTIFFGIAIAIMVGWLLHVGRPILVPVVASILIVFIINGLAGLSRRIVGIGPLLPLWGHRLLASLVIGAAIFGLMSLMLSITEAFAERAPLYQQSLLTAIQQGASFLGVEQELTWQTIRADLLSRTNLPRAMREIALTTVAYIGILLFILLNVGFLLLEEYTFSNKITLLVGDPGRAARIRHVIADVNTRVGRYLALKTLMNLLVAAVSYAVLLIFEVEFAIFWAVLIGIFNYVPYFGSAFGVVLPVAFAAVQFADMDVVLYLLVLLILAQFLVGNIIEPQVMGNSLNLSPWIILIGLTAWGSIWGIAGAIFSVPIMAILVVLFSEFKETRPIAILLSRDGRIGTI